MRRGGVVMQVGMGHTLVGYASTAKGIGKLQLDRAALAADLDRSWEVLAEPIQTVMRRYGVPEPYEKLKAFTRGQRVTQASMQVRVDGHVHTSSSSTVPMSSPIPPSCAPAHPDWGSAALSLPLPASTS